MPRAALPRACAVLGLFSAGCACCAPSDGGGLADLSAALLSLALPAEGSDAAGAGADRFLFRSAGASLPVPAGAPPPATDAGDLSGAFSLPLPDALTGCRSCFLAACGAAPPEPPAPAGSWPCLLVLAAAASPALLSAPPPPPGLPPLPPALLLPPYVLLLLFVRRVSITAGVHASSLSNRWGFPRCGARRAPPIRARPRRRLPRPAPPPRAPPARARRPRRLPRPAPAPRAR